MSAPAFQPAPLMVEPINNGFTFQITTKEQAGFAVIAETEEHAPHAEQYARLFAASPLMQQALETARDFIADELDTREMSMLPISAPGEKGYIDSAKAALAKVTAALAAALPPAEQPETEAVRLESALDVIREALAAFTEKCRAIKGDGDLACRERAFLQGKVEGLQTALERIESAQKGGAL